MTANADGVTVTVLSAEATAEPGLAVTFEVHNGGEDPVWVVDEDELVWSRADDRIELSYARAPMDEGAEPFGYFHPAVSELGAGESLRRTVRLSWPLELNPLWNDHFEVDPSPGHYDLRVRIGYGLSPEPESADLDEDVEAPVLRWQRESVSDPVEIRVPDRNDQAEGSDR